MEKAYNSPCHRDQGQNRSLAPKIKLKNNANMGPIYFNALLKTKGLLGSIRFYLSNIEPSPASLNILNAVEGPEITCPSVWARYI